MMQVLIIDNYDSFTGNLCQLVASVIGQAPLVIRNDALTLAQILNLNVDAIMLSPGPGKPSSGEDFGVCRDVIQHSDLPILGVCLGFQGIAEAYGATVQRAKFPLHGVQSVVRHHARDIFEGLPSPLHAVRYHSLEVVAPMPEALDVLATAMDGTLMAIRHREKPVWGVQFHPESIGTEAGDLLIRNFLRMAVADVPGVQAQSPLSPLDSLSDPDAPPTTHRVRWCRLDTWCEPVDCFAALYARDRHAFWLDSRLLVAGRSRFSFMGRPSTASGALIRYNAQDRIVTSSGPEGQATHLSSTLFDYLDHVSHQCHVTSELPFDFIGGWVGYLGYEARADLGHDVRCASTSPDAQFMFVDTFIAFDHEERAVYAVSVEPAEGADAADARVTDLVDSIASVHPGAAEAFKGVVDMSRAPAFSMSRDVYIERVRDCQELIRDGESYEICLTMSAEGEYAGDAFSLYLSLREKNPAPYAAFFRIDGYAIACSSPERFLKIDRHRWVESKPIKGTAPRGDTDDSDNGIRDALSSSAKNRAENLMIVDLLRNDLSHSCEVGSVHVPRLMDIESYQTVHQMVSTIRGRLRPDASAVDCLRHAFPGGSMTGAPKIRTLQLLNALEPRARGAYSGTLGYLSMNGCADLNIIIRSAIVDGQRVSVGMGGAVTLLSDPLEEYEEAMLKGDVVLRAMNAHAGEDSR